MWQLLLEKKMKKKRKSFFIKSPNLLSLSSENFSSSLSSLHVAFLPSSSPPLLPPLKLQIPLHFYPKLQGKAIFGIQEPTSTSWGFKFQVRVDFFSLEICGCWVFGSYNGQFYQVIALGQLFVKEIVEIMLNLTCLFECNPLFF